MSAPAGESGGGGGEPQVAWIALEDHARVFSGDGHAVGRVSKVVGDAEADVFTGLAVSLGVLGPDRFVPSERVSGIWRDRVELDLTAGEIEQLPAYQEQTAERLRPRDDVLTRLRRLFGPRA